MITAALVKELRDKTGAGMMDCKKALNETNGDIDAAVDYLREKGIAGAAKKSARVAAEGTVAAFKTDCGCLASLIEINSETDFVAKNEKFQNFAKQTAEFVAKNDGADISAELEAKAKEMIAAIGENIVVRRYTVYKLEGAGIISTYIHMGGKIGVMVQFDCDEALKENPEVIEYTKNIAMQIAAVNPTYLNPTDIPTEELEHEKQVLIAQAENEGKPKEIAEKMVQGRIQKFYKEICLNEQPFVKDDKLFIKDYTKQTAKNVGGKLEIVKFVRYQMGEGLDKRKDDFAEEIAKQING
ncbi:MAG: elongation factor Ts [Eubacteriaceae bacterium]|nr:elongation factor Ts [Eubacteriaceae bacterium]